MSPSVPSLKLYEISDNYTAILNQLAEQVDTDGVLPDDLMEALRQIEDDLRTKMVNVAAYVKSLEAEVNAIAMVKQSMDKRQKALAQQAERLRSYLLNEMQRTDLTVITHSWLNLRVQVNPPSVSIVDEAQIPNCFKETLTTVRLLKTAIAQALKSGQEVPGAYLEQSTRLVIQ